MPFRPAFQYLPTAGVRADFKRLMNEFITAKTVRFEHFAEMWKKRKFSFLCAGRCTDRETREFLERSLLIAVEFFLPPYQFQVRVGGLYLLYGIFMTQPIAPKVKVRLTVSQWEDTIQFQQEACDQHHLDVVYIFNRMLEEHAFHFCYTPTEMNERTLNPEREDDEVNLADDMKVEQREIDRLFNYESMEQLSYLLDHYRQMKISMSGRNATKPDKSLDVVQGSMVEDIVALLQSFKESCSNIYKHGAAHPDTSREAGPSRSEQSILSKRHALKSKIYGEVDVHSPVKKFDPDAPSSSQQKNKVPKISKSPSKKSTVRFTDEEKEDVLEQFVSPTGTKRSRGRPRKQTPSFESMLQILQKSQNISDKDMGKDVEESSPLLKRGTKQAQGRGRKSKGHRDSSLDKSLKEENGMEIILFPSSPTSGQSNDNNTGSVQLKDSVTQISFDGDGDDDDDDHHNATPSSKRGNTPKRKKIMNESDTSLENRRTSSRKKKQAKKFSPTLSNNKSKNKRNASSENSSQLSNSMTQSDGIITIGDNEDYNDDIIVSEDKNLPGILAKRQLKPPADRKRMVPSKSIISDSSPIRSKVQVISNGLEKQNKRVIGDPETAGSGSLKATSGKELFDSRKSIHKHKAESHFESSKNENIKSKENGNLQNSPKEGKVRVAYTTDYTVKKESHSSNEPVLKLNPKNSSVLFNYQPLLESGSRIPDQIQQKRPRGRPRKTGQKESTAPKTQKRKIGSIASATYSNGENAQGGGKDQSSKQRFSPQKVVQNFKHVLNDDLANPKKAKMSSEPAGNVKNVKQKTVNVTQTPLSNILGGKSMGQTGIEGKKPIKYIKIVAKSKAEAEEVLKSIEKQRESGNKLLSNLPSGFVQSISVESHLPKSKTVKKRGETSLKEISDRASEPVLIDDSVNPSSAGDSKRDSNKESGINEQKTLKVPEKLVYVSV